MTPRNKYTHIDVLLDACDCHASREFFLFPFCSFTFSSFRLPSSGFSGKDDFGQVVDFILKLNLARTKKSRFFNDCVYAKKNEGGQSKTGSNKTRNRQGDTSTTSFGLR